MSEMFSNWIPAMLRPEHIWPTRKIPLSHKTPPIPSPSHYIVRRFWGYVHRGLTHFSVYYCKVMGYKFSRTIVPLPYGLLLKWTDCTRVEEALVGEMMYLAGIPSPRIICYGDQPQTPHAPGSILMTRLPGREMNQAYPSLSPQGQITATVEFRHYMDVIRGWESPWGKERICSITGGNVQSHRVPLSSVGPCETRQEFYDYLLLGARNWYDSVEEYESLIKEARKLQELQGPRVKFTHGDLHNRNLLVDDDGHITGILDWERAGWMPDFWDFTTGLQWLRRHGWWVEFMHAAGATEFLDCMEPERALFNLTADSF